MRLDVVAALKRGKARPETPWEKRNLKLATTDISCFSLSLNGRAYRSDMAGEEAYAET